MIERLIYTAMRTGLTRTLAEPRFLRRHLQHSYGPRGVTDAEIDKLLTAFKVVFGDAKHKRPIIHQYARTGMRFPLWAIVLGAEEDSQLYLGGLTGEVEYPKGAEKAEPDAGVRVFGASQSHTFHVFAYADHPDLALLMYYASRLFIRRAMMAFVRAELSAVRLSGGDLAPDLEFLPEGLFVRRLTIQCSSQEEAIGDLDDRERRAFGIDVVSGALDADIEPMLDGSEAGVWGIFESDDEAT